MKIKHQNNNLNRGTEVGKSLIDRSIKKFGMREAVTVDRDGNIVSGNHRKKFAEKNGITSERIVKASRDEVIIIQYDDLCLEKTIKFLSKQLSIYTLMIGANDSNYLVNLLYHRLLCFVQRKC